MKLTEPSALSLLLEILSIQAMGCCISRCSRRGGADSLPTINEETEVSAEVAQNLKDVPDYPTSSDEDQALVTLDRRPRLSLIPALTPTDDDARILSKATRTTAPNTLASADVIDAHMGVHQADSISTNISRRSQWEAVALTIAARRRSRDVTHAPENLRRVSWSPTAGSPVRKRRAIDGREEEASPYGTNALRP
jgi:hypothetical protein